MSMKICPFSLKKLLFDVLTCFTSKRGVLVWLCVGKNVCSFFLVAVSMWCGYLVARGVSSVLRMSTRESRAVCHPWVQAGVYPEEAKKSGQPKQNTNVVVLSEAQKVGWSLGTSPVPELKVVKCFFFHETFRCKASSFECFIKLKSPQFNSYFLNR